MKQATRHHSHLFLLEITLAILFFSLASAVCLRCFAKSHTLSQQAAELNQAVSQTENVAELLRSLPENKRTDIDQITKTLQEEYPMTKPVEPTASSVDPELDHLLGQWTLYFDKNWNACEKTHAVYQMQVLASDTAIDSTEAPTTTSANASVVVFHMKVARFSKENNTEVAKNSSDSRTKTAAPKTADNIYQLELKLYAKES